METAAAPGSLGGDTGAAGAAGLPPLREELDFLPAAPSPRGTPCWTLHDPVRNRFFRLGWVEREILRRWPLRCARAIAGDLARATAIRIEPATVEAVGHFLAANQLLAPPAGQTPTFRPKPPAAWLSLLLRHYLFFRAPLWRPDALLDALLPYARPLFSRAFLLGVLCLTLAGLYLVSRDWDAFVHGLPYFFTPAGAFAFGLTVAGAKVLHEFGHALAAKRCGLKVPVMGVAFMVLWPMLYTDTTDAWRLADRRKRLVIDAAGMAAELAAAGLALFLWNFFSPGPVKSALFVLATVVWVKTLAVNLSPFMRFDGYYLLSDLLGIENLHDRASAFGRHFLRRTVLGLGNPVPEPLPAGIRRFLIGFACATWLYRVTVFTAIALAVYHFFFKALGLLLFVVEFGWFIVLPVAREARAWFGLRAEGKARLGIAAFLAAALIAAFCIPWSTAVFLPAVLQDAAQARVFPPRPARIEAIHVSRGQTVRPGDPLFTLSSPETVFRLEQATSEAQSLRLELARGQFAEEEADRIRVVEERLAEAMAARSGYERENALLAVRAPLSGVVVELPDTLRPGLWVSGATLLAVVVDQERATVEGLAREAALGRIAVGQHGAFYPETPDQPVLPLIAAAIEQTPTWRLSSPYLASLYGGGAPVRESPDGTLVCDEALYRVILRPDGAVEPLNRVQRGIVRLQGRPLSLLARARLAVLAVLVRESEL